MGQNVIELNGKRYDAVSGTYLGKSHVIPKHILERHVHGRVIDGFIRPESASGVRVSHKTPVTTPKPPAKSTAESSPSLKQTSAKPAHTIAVHAKAHHPERSKTLIRRVTKKPEFSLKPVIKPQAPAEVMAKPASALMRKRSVYSVDPARRERAVLSGRHGAVRHFLPHTKIPAIHAVSAEVPVIAVRPTPDYVSRNPQYASRHSDIFESAIASATSHLEPKHKVRTKRSKSRRLINSLATIAAFLVIGGFISYLNLPRLEMRVASIQAGFGASLPTYAPTGYALEDGVKRTGGTVYVSFRSGSSRYTLTQQSSNWNSQTLLDNTLALNGQHQTVQKNGQTIYIYNNGSAASWVNGGVRYDITGNAELSNDEITRIATSL